MVLGGDGGEEEGDGGEDVGHAVEVVFADAEKGEMGDNAGDESHEGLQGDGGVGHVVFLGVV